MLYYHSTLKPKQLTNKIDNDDSIEIKDRTPCLADYWPLASIHINNNWTETNSTFNWCNGKGTKEEPYILENITINQGNDIGIIIENSREFFKIKNCSISNSNIGIKLSILLSFKLIIKEKNAHRELYFINEK